jgi:aryl-alcohol dehydrogenase-like predicted oxidoreductase
MQTRPLGGTGVDVPVLSFGTAPLGGLFGPLDEADAVRLVHEAIDLGLTFIDTSPYYGTAEARLGRALKDRRNDVLLGTKAGRYGYDEFDFSPRRIRDSVEESLRLLGTDHVDILQLHDIEFVSLDGVLSESLAELVRLRDEGKCRFIGMTGYPLATMRRVVTESGVDVVLTYAHGTCLTTRSPSTSRHWPATGASVSSTLRRWPWGCSRPPARATPRGRTLRREHSARPLTRCAPGAQRRAPTSPSWPTSTPSSAPTARPR